MNIEFYTRSTFTEQQIDILREQNVNMDDWDIILITHELDQFHYFLANNEITTEPKDWLLNHMLEGGVYDSKFYRIEWNGKEAIVGLRYHS